MAGRGRGRGRGGRGRKRGAEFEYGETAGKYLQNRHHQSHNNISIRHQASQDYPFSSTGVVLTSPPYSNKTSTHSATLRPTLIINLDKDDDPTPELHRQHGKDKEADESSVELISEIPGPQEVGSSSSDGAFECVGGHRVKAQFAPLLRAIFDKHGDITRGADVKSPYLERLCHVYQRLETAKLVDLTRGELQGIISQLRLLERRKVRVGWILERVEYISEMKATFDASIERMEKDLEGYERQVCLLQQKISSTKQELLMHKSKTHQIN